MSSRGLGPREPPACLFSAADMLFQGSGDGPVGKNACCTSGRLGIQIPSAQVKKCCGLCTVGRAGLQGLQGSAQLQVQRETCLRRVGEECQGGS